MKVQLGPIVLEINQVGRGQIEIKVLTPGNILRSVDSPAEKVTPRDVPVYATKQEYSSQSEDPAEDLKTLISVGFTRKTLSMIINKVLNVPISGQTLGTKFQHAEVEAMEFLERPIDKGIWALYLAPVELQDEEKALAAIGLSEKNQLVILALDSSTPPALFQQLQQRGLTTEQLKFAVVSLHSGALADFKQAYPNTTIGMDWGEFADSSRNAEIAASIRDAMFYEDEKDIKKILSHAKAPKEMANFMKYKKTLWRALRTTAPVARLNRDLRTKLRSAAITNDHQKDLIKAFSLIRIQYHWLKIPIDAPQLKNLKYMQTSTSLDDDSTY